ncbi:MAG: arginase, partial [Paracoccaceae bacterium]
MARNTCILIGAPVDSGKRRTGCLMGPDAYRTAGLAQALGSLGHKVEDMGNLAPAAHVADTGDTTLHAPNQTIGWTNRLIRVAETAMTRGTPIFLGGDHSLSLGSVAGVANYAATLGRKQFVLWLDAHSDFHTPETSASGNLHGTPLGYVTGRGGFAGFPTITNPIPQENICILGLRSVDGPEREALEASAINRHDMREIDETGIARPLSAFLDKVSATNGMLH